MQAFTYTPFKARFQFFLRSCRRPEIRGAPLCAFVPFDSRDFLFSPLVAPGVGQWLLRAPLFHVNLVRYAFLPPCARRAAVENSVHSLEEGGGVARAWLIAGTRRLPPFPSSFCGCKNLSCIRREGEKMAVNLARWRLKVDCREEGLSYDVKLNVPFFFFFFLIWIMISDEILEDRFESADCFFFDRYFNRTIEFIFYPWKFLSTTKL